MIVGKYPFRTIALCWLLVILSGFGFLRFRQEKDPLKLWVPPQTSFVRDSQWLIKTLQRGYRDQTILIAGDDVLTPEVFQQVRRTIFLPYIMFLINLSFSALHVD